MQAHWRTGRKRTDRGIGRRNLTRRKPPSLRLLRLEEVESRRLLANTIFTVPGAAGEVVNLRFDWMLREAGFDNELGVFRVQDTSGSVNGLLPGAAGYAAAALGGARVVFGSGARGGAHSVIAFNGGDLLGFYLVQDNTTAQAKSNATNSPGSGALTFFSLDAANPDGFIHAQSGKLVDGTTQISWEDLTGGGDRDCNDAVIKVGPSNARGVPIGGSTGQQIQGLATLLARGADFSNEVGYVIVDSIDGRLGNLLPGDPGYSQAALASAERQVLFAPGDGAGATRNLTLPGGKFLGLYLIADGTTQQFLATNPTNGDGGPRAYFSFIDANPDGVEHLQWLNGTDVGFEDLFGGGDFDYDDVRIRLVINSAPDTTVPVVTADLFRDTAPGGTANSDRITFDGTVVGTIVDASAISRLEASIGSRPAVDITSVIGAGGAFTITRARLDQLAGGILPDGLVSLRLVATDSAGNVSQPLTVSFTLDTTVPLAPNFNLAPASDTAPVGDRRTNAAIVDLAGQTSAGAVVRLGGGAFRTTDANGAFQFEDVGLAAGPNELGVTAADVAGNESSFVQIITRNMDPTVATPLADVAVDENASPSNFALAGVFTDPDIQETIVRMRTSLGPIDIQLFDTQTPISVANFLKYVLDGDYDESIIHRTVTNFVVQGGAFEFVNTPDRLAPVPTDPAILNEPGISNTRGTVAMAKLPGNPNSATSQFFFNLRNNATDLDNSNGGFTVFGRVIGDGMDVVDAIAAVPRFDFDAVNSALGELPLRDFTNTGTFPGNTTRENYIVMDDVEVIRRRDQLTISATSSNSNLAAVTIDQGTLRVTYGAGQTGTATITVRATDLDGSFVEETFQVVVSPAGGASTFAALVNTQAADQVHAGDEL